MNGTPATEVVAGRQDRANSRTFLTRHSPQTLDSVRPPDVADL